jgi:hypothetical protein
MISMVLERCDEVVVESTAPPSPVEIRVVDPLESSTWDDQVLQFPEATIFHSAAWCRTLLEAYGYTPLYLAAYRGAEMIGALPLMEVKSRLTGTRGVSLPFSDFVPPLVREPEVADTLLENALELGREKEWKYLDLRDFAGIRVQGSGFPPSPDDGLRRASRVQDSEKWVQGSGFRVQEGNALIKDRASPTAVARRAKQKGPPEPRTLLARRSPEGEGGNPEPFSYYEHTLPLTPDLDALFESFHPSTRRAIRKGEKNGLVVSVDTDIQNVKEFYRLNCLTRRGHGLPPQPFAFFLALHRNLLESGRGFGVTVRFEKTPIASSVFLDFGSNASYKYGASEMAHLRLRGNNLAMWAGIKQFAQGGITRLSLGRTSPEDEGLCRFKRGWGTHERIVTYHRLTPRMDGEIPLEIGESDRFSEIFRRLPIPILRMMGTMLYRHVG